MFDKEKFYLGSLCKRGHEYENTGQSLRRLNGDCIECDRVWKEKNREKTREQSKEYYIKNKEKRQSQIKIYEGKNKNKLKEYRRKYYEENKEKISNKKKEYDKEYYKTNRKKLNEKSRKYRNDNPEKIKKYEKTSYNRKMLNSTTRLNHHFSNRVRQTLKQGKDGHHWETIVDYSVEELKNHLEGQFEKEMSWDNWGRGEDKWHIDHIQPVSSFNFTSYEDEEFKKCWALDNLQPLWEKDNLRKSNKLNWRK